MLDIIPNLNKIIIIGNNENSIIEINDITSWFGWEVAQMSIRSWTILQ